MCWSRRIAMTLPEAVRTGRQRERAVREAKAVRLTQINDPKLSVWSVLGHVFVRDPYSETLGPFLTDELV